MNLIDVFSINMSILMILREIFSIILNTMYFLPDNRCYKILCAEHFITNFP